MMCHLPLNLDDVREFTVDLLTEVGVRLRDLQSSGQLDVHRKRDVELVTSADLLSDELLRRAITARFPSHVLLSEESGQATDLLDLASPLWVLDPLDGTVNYAHGHPHVAISAALAVHGRVQVGVVHCPFLHETYSAIRGCGAYNNGEPIKVSGQTALREALISTGFPHDRGDLEADLRRVQRILEACQGLRRLASPAIDICWVAAGRLDGHSESMGPWDVAAAGLIAREAGAKMGHLKPLSGSQSPELCGNDVVIAAPGVYSALVDLLR